MKLSAKISAWLFAAAFMILLSCDDDEDPAVTYVVTVNHYLQPTSHISTHQGYWIQDKIDPETWVLHGTPIEGFDFDWGYTYELLVQETVPQPGFEDMPEPAWKLVRIVSKTKVPEDTTFPLSLSTSDYIHNITVDEALNFTLSNGMTINCGSLCEEFSEKLAQQTATTPTFPLTAAFKHVSNTTIELTGVWLEEFED